MDGLQTGVPPTPIPGGGHLALVYQEILTAIVRLRSNRQAVADAGSFRNQIKAAIGMAEADATRRAYPPEDVRLATFAVVAFLDESILNSYNPLFTDWPRMPLQEELFGVHTAGEMFFSCIDRLMAKGDSPQAADVLEIYSLCLWLGFRGRYSMSGLDATRGIATTVSERLQRLRGGPRPLDPRWAAPKDATHQRASDPWVRGLFIGALGALVLAILLFVGFKFALISGAAALR